MKKSLVTLLLLMSVLSNFAQDRTYGPFYGVHVYAYKSNLLNSDDLRVDSFQKYQFTPGAGGSLEYGYLYQSGFSIATGLSFGTNNQKYVGNHMNYAYDLEATTKLSFIKIPLTLTFQAHRDRKLKYFYSLGVFYSYNTGFSDVKTINYKDSISKAPTETHTIDKDTYTITLDTTKLQTVLSMDQRPVVRNGFGATAGLGINYKVSDKVQFIAQVKGEFLISNIEVIEKTRFQYVQGTNNVSGFPFSGYVYNNYAKYMNDPNRNWNRASTNPFNLGISLGIRFYLFDFNDRQGLYD